MNTSDEYQTQVINFINNEIKQIKNKLYVNNNEEKENEKILVDERTKMKERIQFFQESLHINTNNNIQSTIDYLFNTTNNNITHWEAENIKFEDSLKEVTKICKIEEDKLKAVQKEYDFAKGKTNSNDVDPKLAKQLPILKAEIDGFKKKLPLLRSDVQKAKEKEVYSIKKIEELKKDIKYFTKNLIKEESHSKEPEKINTNLDIKLNNEQSQIQYKDEESLLPKLNDLGNKNGCWLCGDDQECTCDND
jgi:hypothetical protein